MIHKRLSHWAFRAVDSQRNARLCRNESSKHTCPLWRRARRWAMDEHSESIVSVTYFRRLIFVNLQHKRFVNETKLWEPDVLFMGDSIIRNLAYSEMWKNVFVPMHPLNFGIGGDQTQHVLWRSLNGELEHIKPKVCTRLGRSLWFFFHKISYILFYNMQLCSRLWCFLLVQTT